MRAATPCAPKVPLKSTRDRVLYATRDIGPDVSRWWLPILLGTAAGATTGVIVGGKPTETICP